MSILEESKNILGVEERMSDQTDDNQNPGDEENLTPEEKLFRAIVADDESTPQRESRPVVTEKKSAVISGFVEKIKGALGKISFKPKRTVVKPPENRGLRTRALSEIADVKTLNRGMLIVVFMLLVYLILDLFFGSQSAVYEGKGHGPNSPGERSALSGVNFEVPQKKPLAHYLDVVQSRDAFSPFVPVQEIVEPTEPAVLDAAPAEIPEIRLVGISWDSDGYVAMVEVADESFAKFVHEGDSVVDGVKVKEVQEYKVILTRNGQEWDLN